MIYCVYSEDGLRKYINVGDKKIIDVIVRSYLKGIGEIIINGVTYGVGRVTFQVYETNCRSEIELEVEINALLQVNQELDDYVLNNNFKNITSDLLQGRGWSDLRDDFFNIYINDGDKRPVITVLNRNEVEEFLKNWEDGASSIWVSGRRIDLKNPKSIRVFDVKFEYLSKSPGEVKEFQRKSVALLFGGKWSLNALEYFGRDVSSEWNVKPYRKAAVTSTNFNWNLIHPDISIIAQPRFKSSHYADAVEAVFKEINDIIKVEYKRLTGHEEDGATLMRKVFAHTSPKVKLTDLSNESLRNVQEGYMNIFAGVMSGIRNPKAHANLQISQEDAWEKIVLASHLMKMWDKRIKGV